MKRKITKKPAFTVLTNDPSFTAWGWAVLDENHNILDQGCIKTEPGGKKSRIRKGDDRVKRISEINQALLEVIRKYDVKYILSELPHGSQNAQAAIMVGATAAIVATIGDCLGIGVEWYSEGDAKKCALGKQSSSKLEMINAMDKLYKVGWYNTKYKDEAVADALAIHHVASTQSSILKMFKA